MLLPNIERKDASTEILPECVQDYVQLVARVSCLANRFLFSVYILYIELIILLKHATPFIKIGH